MNLIQVKYCNILCIVISSNSFFFAELDEALELNDATQELMASCVEHGNITPDGSEYGDDGTPGLNSATHKPELLEAEKTNKSINS